MKIEVKFGNKKRKIELHKVSWLGKFSGLMFHSRNTRNLLFSFGSDGKRAMHSMFVFFPYLSLWLDKNMKVMEWRAISPFSTIILPKKPFRNVIEIPFNDRNKKIIEFIVGRKRFK